MSLKEGIELNLTAAEWISDYIIRLAFSDGFTRDLNFQPFLEASTHPEIRKYLEPESFKAFEISYGNLIWNDYDLCFSIDDLYSGNLVSQQQDSMVAEDSPGYGE
ncbi:DUF2442 domain-containing protein [Pontiella sp.]|uniref:DUF2442 domain-containing protein n=1 Tax=Pontiella sp. TaxID=2837462 RepID=UPI00356B1699